MYLTDPIADMFSRIMNALRVKAEVVDMPASKIKTELAKLLRDEGFITKFELLTKGSKKDIRITLRYRKDGRGVIRRLERVSRPGRRAYATRQNIPRVMAGFGVILLTTSKGIMTDQQARQSSIGGEVIGKVY